MPAPASPFLSLLRFHCAVGARLAMRTFVPPVAAVIGGGFLLGNDFLTSLALALFGPRSSGGTAGLLALICLGASATAAPRIARGVNGWLRHLPLRSADHRRAVAWSAAFAQTPILLFLLFLAACGSRSPVTLLVDALGLAVTAYAAAQATVPAARGLWTRPLALAGAVTACTGDWGALALGALLAGLADAAAGALPHGAPAALAPHRRRERGGRLLPWRIAARALGARVLGAYLPALLPFGAAWAFVAHNELRPAHVQLAARLGLGAALVLLLASLGETLAVRRPAWPWSRSLPWSARDRVRADALFLGIWTVPLFALGIAFQPLAALWIAPLLPLLAQRTAGAVRRAPERRSGASGEILAEGMLLVAACALLPWVALLAVAATPLAERSAAARERRQKVSRWLELHALAVGDPQSWSSS